MENLRIGKKGLVPDLVPILTERRIHPRIPLRLPTEYFPAGTTKGRICHTINISESGILLCLPEKIKTGQTLRIEVFYYFDYELASFEALGEVVWFERFEDSDRESRCALEFMDLSLDDLEKLKRFLRKIFY